MQQSFADMEYANRKRKTKRDEFLEVMEEVIPWDEWAMWSHIIQTGNVAVRLGE